MTRHNPQQPGLPAFVVFDKAPVGCITFTVPNNRSAPFLRTGDIAVIDTADTMPARGELFLLQWGSGRRQVVEPVEDGQYWQVCWQMPVASLSGETETMRWGDGPYLEAALAAKLIGRVVGILEPRFSEPMRALAGRA